MRAKSADCVSHLGVEVSTVTQTLYDPVPPGHDLTASVVARSETGLKPLGKNGPTGDMLNIR